MHIILNVLIISVLNIFLAKEAISLADKYDKERAHNTFFKMLQTDRLHRSVVEDFLSVFGIHRSQHMILLYLSKEENCSGQKAIAQHFKISPAAVTVTLKKLEEGGYISRCCREKDSRFNSITLLDKGKELVAKSRTLFENTDKAMFDGFTDEEYEIFERCLDKMMSGLSSYKENLNSAQ